MFDGITSQHFLYIPMVVLLGLVIGYVLGSRSVHAEYALKRERMKK